ncbi:MAG: hypothetical protein NVS3B20_23960 [Polyangiales bacterium]
MTIEVPRFNTDYYRRYYLDPRTRVDDARHHALLARGVVSMVEWYGADLRSVLDVGAGVGRWGAWLRKHRPKVEVVSTELESEICERYGHLQCDIAQWQAPRKKRFDLVICQGVLPYLKAEKASAAIDNLA